jgi:prevent-host-death family protein
MITLDKPTLDIPESIAALLADGEPVIIRANGKPVAVLISYEEYTWFRKWEDKMDLAAIQRARRESSESGEEPVLLEEAAAKYGVELHTGN